MTGHRGGFFLVFRGPYGAFEAPGLIPHSLGMQKTAFTLTSPRGMITVQPRETHRYTNN